MKTVLIVDDSRVIQKLLERKLSSHFRIVGTGSNGIEGFELYERLKPDLVLLDIVMPNCNGKECLKNIMNQDPQARVIMVSSVGDEQTIKECLELGAKAFIPKDLVTATGEAASTLIDTAKKVVSTSTTSEAA